MHLNVTLYKHLLYEYSLPNTFLAFSTSLFNSFYLPFSCSLFQDSALQYVRFLLCLLLLHISSSTIITFLYMFSLQSHTCTHTCTWSVSKPYLKQNEMHVVVSYAILASCNELQNETRQPNLVRLKGKVAGICNIHCALKFRRHVYVGVCT